MIRLGRHAAVVVAAATLNACAIGPEPPELNISPPDAYTSTYEGTGADRLWWEGFNDPRLDDIVERALRSNLTIEAADARMRRAEQLARAGMSDLFPQIDASISSIVQSDRTQQTSSALFGRWTPDLFGGRRRALAAARASERSAASQRQDAERLIVSALASTYIELLRTDAQRALLRQSLELQQQTLRIVKLRADAGLAADLDVQRAAGDLARTRAQSGPLNAARQRAENALSVLIAEPPGTFRVDANDEQGLPLYNDGYPLGVPADLLRSRPDIRAAEEQLAASAHLIGVEMSDLLPSLNLTGFISTGLTPTDFTSGAIRRLTFVLDVPLLDAGRRLAEVRAARALTDEALSLYQLSLLRGIEDVENGLAGIDAQEQRREDLRAAVQASEVSFNQLQALYTEGLASLIDVLDAQRQLIASREAFTNSEAAVASSYIELHTAIGAPTSINDDDGPRDHAG